MEAPFEISRKWSTGKRDSDKFSAEKRNQEAILTESI